MGEPDLLKSCVLNIVQQLADETQPVLESLRDPERVDILGAKFLEATLRRFAQHRTSPCCTGCFFADLFDATEGDAGKLGEMVGAACEMIKRMHVALQNQGGTVVFTGRTGEPAAEVDLV